MRTRVGVQQGRGEERPSIKEQTDGAERAREPQTVLAEHAALQLQSKQGCGHASCSFPLGNGSEPQQHLTEETSSLTDA